MSYKNVIKVVITMVSLLRLKGYGGQAGFSVQVSGNREQSAPCHLSSDFGSAELVAGCALSSVLDRRIKINKIQIGFIDICNYGAYLNGDYTRTYLKKRR